ncbi:hypothetical protein [Mycolicibacterium agri]|uniref:hypothetical protein n=1 Tax=Mycolicibacterium agri TaxID=36811 RepID=UPI0010555D75|nr:hypothetical protein [Mycolicibacterium agri]
MARHFPVRRLLSGVLLGGALFAAAIGAAALASAQPTADSAPMSVLGPVPAFPPPPPPPPWHWH